MCAAERDSDFDKWPWLSRLLGNAIAAMYQALESANEPKDGVSSQVRVID